MLLVLLEAIDSDEKLTEEEKQRRKELLISVWRQAGKKLAKIERKAVKRKKIGVKQSLIRYGIYQKLMYAYMGKTVTMKDYNIDFEELNGFAARLKRDADFRGIPHYASAVGNN